MLETSTTTAKLEAALAKAQAGFSSAAKDKENPHFKSKYADLASIWEACRSALTSNGICVMQWLVHGEDTRLHIVTRLAHEGEWMQARWSMPVSKQDPQGYGSAATYARRYALAAAVGVVADEDDDANHASERPRQQKTSPGSRGAATRKDAGERPSQGVADRSIAPSSPDFPPTDADGWKTRIDLAASVSLEELDSLSGEIDKVEDDVLKERLRRYQDEKRKRIAARAAAKRIASGDAPTEPEGA